MSFTYSQSMILRLRERLLTLFLSQAIQEHWTFTLNFWSVCLIWCKKNKRDDAVVNVHAVGHANHHFESNMPLESTHNYNKYNTIQYNTLQFEIDHKCNFISNILLSTQKIIHGKRSIIIIGHSIGCYMIFIVLRQSHIIRTHTIDMIHLIPFIF